MTALGGQQYRFDARTKTPTSTVKYSVWFADVKPVYLLELVQKQTFENLCRSGCANYQKKWSCPPFTPVYQDYVQGFQHLYVLYMKSEMAQFLYIRNDYLKIKAANSILKSRADKYLRHMASKYGKYISTGSCRLCKPCKCKLGVPCAHPDKMSYSFEALGVDVGALVEDCFQSKLLWYKRGFLPEYTSVVCGLLSNIHIPLEKLHEEYLGYL